MGMLENFREVLKIANVANNTDLYKRVSELQNEVMSLMQGKQDLETENRQLKEQLKIKGKLVKEKSSYWLLENGKKEGPLCIHCYDSSGKVINMVPLGDGIHYNCITCKYPIQIEAYDDNRLPLPLVF